MILVQRSEQRSQAEMIVYGYIRQIESILLVNIPMDIFNLCFMFYFSHKFMETFTSNEIAAVYKSFTTLDKYKTGYLKYSELAKIRDRQMDWYPDDLLSRHIFDAFTGSNSGLLSFCRFIH